MRGFSWVKSPYPSWRARIGWRLRCWADDIDREHAAVHMSSYSFTFETGEGIRFRNDGKGCPLAFFSQEYDRAHTEADKQTPGIDWPAQIDAWAKLSEDLTPRLRNSGQKQFLVMGHKMGRSNVEALRRAFEENRVHVPAAGPELDYLTFDSSLPDSNPAYWWAANHDRFPCFYKSEWTDEVGDIWVCQVHKNNSRHDVGQGFDKPCLTLDPYPKETDEPASGT